jgi:hypothetical protein
MYMQRLHAALPPTARRDRDLSTEQQVSSPGVSNHVRWGLATPVTSTSVFLQLCPGATEKLHGRRSGVADLLIKIWLAVGERQKELESRRFEAPWKNPLTFGNGIALAGKD